jgi:hypothetical protein
VEIRFGASVWEKAIKEWEMQHKKEDCKDEDNAVFLTFIYNVVLNARLPL